EKKLTEAISSGVDCQGPIGKNLAWISNEAVKIAQTEFDRHRLAAPAACGDGGGVRGDHSNTESLERLFPSNMVKCRRPSSSPHLLDSAARPSLNLPSFFSLCSGRAMGLCTSTGTRRTRNGTAGCAPAGYRPGETGLLTTYQSLSGPTGPGHTEE